MQTRKRRREWIVALTLGILNYTSAVAAETPFSAAELRNALEVVSFRFKNYKLFISIKDKKIKVLKFTIKRQREF